MIYTHSIQGAHVVYISISASILQKTGTRFYSCLTKSAGACILRGRMENQTTDIDLSTLDTEAMRSRLSELGSYL